MRTACHSIPIVSFALLFSLLPVDGGLALDNQAGGGGFCNKRRCYNECVDAYGRTGGPVITCRKLCDIKPTCGDKLSADMEAAKPQTPAAKAAKSKSAVAE